MRQILRDRSRYETANNGYAAGIVRSRADDLVGVGPALQLLTPDEDVNDQIEKRFCDWAWASGLCEKLHTLDMAENQDGEAFALLTSNPKLKDPVKLDVVPIECDLVTDPTFGGYLDPEIDDGVTYDAAGNPVSYTILRYHPGDQRYGMATVEYDVWPAEYVLHSYRCDRPGQLRGIPELTSSLPLFAYLRRWTLATLAAAETAASFAAMLETDAPADGETDEPVPFDTLEIERGLMTTLPAGTRMNQLRAEHPNSLFSDVKREILAEAARPVQMPANIALGDSSRHNFSSAKLDHYGYRAAIRVRRRIRERNVLDRVFLAWLEEARKISGHIPAVEDEELEWCWSWPGWASMDKDQASLDTERLNNGTATLAELSAEEGVDWRERIRQRGKELKAMQAEGITPPSAPPAPAMGGGGGVGEPSPAPGQENPEHANGRVKKKYLAAAFDPDQPRDDRGQWTEGGGSGSDDAPREMTERWDHEDTERHESWEREDAEAQQQRDVEDANLAREEWELDQQEEEIEKEFDKEYKKLEREDAREDRVFEKKWDKEEREIEKRRDKEAAKFEKEINGLPKEEQDRRWQQYHREREESHNQEDTEFADRKEAEEKEIDQRREDRDAQINNRRGQEEADIARRRESLAGRNKELQQRRDAEDKAVDRSRRELTEAEEKRRDEEYEKYRRERPKSSASKPAIRASRSLALAGHANGHAWSNCITAYDPDQARDESGKWTSGGGGGGEKEDRSERDVSRYSQPGPRGERWINRSENTTYEGVPNDEAKNITREQARDALRWHEGMTVIAGSNGPNHSLPNASRPQLNEDQRGALQKYSYKNDGPLNGMLRGKDGWDKDTPYGPEFFNEMHAQLESSFARAEPFPKPVPVVRGMRLSPAAAEKFLSEMHDAAASGGTVSFKGYTSTTRPNGLMYRLGMSTGVREPFRGNITLKINATHGIDMKPFSQLPGEGEMLLPHGARFSVASVEYKRDGHHITLNQIPPPRGARSGLASADMLRAAADAGPDDSLTDEEREALERFWSEHPEQQRKWVDTDTDFIVREGAEEGE